MPLTLVGIGCGARTRGYLTLAARQPDAYQVAGAADPVSSRVAEMARLAIGEFHGFASADECFAAGRLGDVAVIGTQDAYHLYPAVRAMELGYDLLLEKPLATTAADVVALAAIAAQLDRRVVVCHVLRYTALYQLIKKVVASGALGRILTLDAREGLGAFHQVHSYVRGHWARTGSGVPMILAKSCHDTDVIAWIIGQPATRVSSFGALSWFHEGNAPVGSPLRCTDGCPVAAGCRYDAHRYLTTEGGWLELVMDGAASASPEQRLAWLTESAWSRCAWRCDNDAVDHQVLAVEFAGGAAATFTMTGLDDDGRTMIIVGTDGVLRAGDRLHNDIGAWATVTDRFGRVTEYGRAEGDAFSGHAGGDAGIVDALAAECSGPTAQMRSGIAGAVEGHLIGFAAEESRVTGRMVEMDEFRGRAAEAAELRRAALLGDPSVG